MGPRPRPQDPKTQAALGRCRGGPFVVTAGSHSQGHMNIVSPQVPVAMSVQFV